MSTEEQIKKTVEEAQQTPEETTPEETVSIENIGEMSDEEFLANEDELLKQLQMAQLPATEQLTSTDTSETPNPNPEQTEEPKSSSDEANTEKQAEQTNVQEQTGMTDTEFRKFITSTFRANNSDVQVEDANDIRRLMQMGLNYQKKMAEIKPYRKIGESLKQNGLLDESRINFAIELLKGNKQAIAQLLKEHSVESFDLPDLEEQPYTPTNHLMSDARLSFDEKLKDLDSSESGRTVLGYIRDLDEDSFNEVYANPQMLDNLHRHVESGLFKEASGVLAREYALGRVPANVKAIDAYAFVADQLEQQNPGKYSLQAQPKVVGNNLQPQQTVVSNKPQDLAKQAAAIPTNGQPRQSTQPQVTADMIANLSDADMEQYGSWEQFLAKNKVRF